MGGVGALGLGGLGSQRQEHKQHVLFFVSLFGLAREGQLNKQSKRPRLNQTSHRFTAAIIGIGGALGL